MPLPGSFDREVLRYWGGTIALEVVVELDGAAVGLVAPLASGAWGGDGDEHSRLATYY